MSKKEMLNNLSKGTPSSTTAAAETNKGFAGRMKQRWWVVAIIGVLSLGVLGSTLKYLDEDAKSQLAKRSAATPLKPHEEPLLNSVNPFLAAPSPTATPQLAKEYIYAGSRLLAVEDANANAAAPADLAIWRPDTSAGNGVWWVMGSSYSQQVGFAWGSPGDLPVQGDFDGDGKTDFSVYRPSTGYWYIQKSSNNSTIAYAFGTTNDVVVPADYDGDGRTDAAVYRPSSGMWYIQRSSDGGMTSHSLGISTDIPVAADYDGDGSADVAVWRSSTTVFYILRSSSNSIESVVYGAASDKPFPADYDGDGKADIALRRGANWFIRKSSNSLTDTVPFQQEGDLAVPNDYDGDGKVDVAVWRPSNGDWYIRQSSKIGQANELRQDHWGQAGDIPVPAFYKR